MINALFGILLLITTFLGYAIGRIGHIMNGYKDGIHHWIPALMIIIISTLFIKHWWGKIAFCFGTGLFISDLNDFLHLRISGPDVVEKYVFWGID